MSGFFDYLKMLLGWWNTGSTTPVEPPICNFNVRLLVRTDYTLRLLTETDFTVELNCGGCDGCEN